ncbi:MAG: ImmA/IrrE family metallo-endopeptidase [Gemmatimonadota bacterium]|nr:ImmA/IrrE family metallo-endopeptidase [Gemmatimonadota bacterium]
MSAIGGEEVLVVPPARKAEIEELADSLLHRLCPANLQEPQPLDALALIDQLEHFGIHFMPGSFEEMGHRIGLAVPSGDGPVNVLIREDQWESLLAGGRRANMSRATVAHELGHALIHVPFVRRKLKYPGGQNTLNRVSSMEIPAYLNSEWQAWMFAGALLAPRQALMKVLPLSVHRVAEVFEISMDLASRHVRRLDLELPGLKYEPKAKSYPPRKRY